MAGFVLLWGSVAQAVRRFDPIWGLSLPSWARTAGVAVMLAGGFLGATWGWIFGMVFALPRSPRLAWPQSLPSSPSYLNSGWHRLFSCLKFPEKYMHHPD